jgi:hypothetical protein
MVINEVRNILKELKEYKEISMLYPSDGIDLIVSNWDVKITKKYKNLQNCLNDLNIKEERIKLLVNRMPKHIWIFKKYRFEITFCILGLSAFFSFLSYAPIFKGMITFSIFSLMLAYYISRDQFIGKLWNLEAVIRELISEFEKIEKELNARKSPC